MILPLASEVRDNDTLAVSWQVFLLEIPRHHIEPTHALVKVRVRGLEGIRLLANFGGFGPPPLAEFGLHAAGPDLLQGCGAVQLQRVALRDVLGGAGALALANHAPHGGLRL